MKVVRTDLPEVLLIEPRVYQDERGFFLESYNKRTFRDATGLDVDFVQDNQSFSVRNVLRGCTTRCASQALVHVMAGEIFDVAVDLVQAQLDLRQMDRRHAERRWPPHDVDPAGFAHGYLVLSEHAIVFYKATDFYAPEHERACCGMTDLAIRWPLMAEPTVSDKDRRAPRPQSADVFE